MKFHSLLLLCFAASLTASPAITFAQNSDPSSAPAPTTDAPQQNTQAMPQAPQFPPNYKPAAPMRSAADKGSTYIPLDSWIYPAVLRLYSMGYVDSVYVGMRPWTRLSVAYMLEGTADKINDGGDTEAQGIYLALLKEVEPFADASARDAHGTVQLESVYSRFLGISGTPLRDSYHVGETLINDYGRPYSEGFNNSSGFSARGQAGRFSLYFRGEYQHAPSYNGYSDAVSITLLNHDELPFVPGQINATIPSGLVSSVDSFRVIEGDLSYALGGHEFSFGKTDAWLGPASGGSLAWSNNAENIYSFRVNRVMPLNIPFVSKVLGPVRYDFFVGSLKGHTTPNHPWVHAEKFSFKPTGDLEFGFERTVIWGGQGHEPVNVRSFLRSFFSLSDTAPGVKFSRVDPGARFSAFDFSYRLPFVRNWLTFYTDSEVHDDVTPPSAPRRSALRPGLYLSHFPMAPKLDLRFEAATTDPRVKPSQRGEFMYYETVQRNGYTNKGQLFGDWIGREGKGGQAWLTYHLSPQESIQVNYRMAKADKDFIAGGTTQNDIGVDVVKRLSQDIELHGWFQYEHWNVPLLKPGVQTDTSTALQITFYPGKKQNF